MKVEKVNLILWIIYICLLGVLLPHTAWLFGSFEPSGLLGQVTGWAGAFAFEAAIAVLTHKLAGHWEQAPVRTARWAGRWVRLRYWYGNAYLAGLMLAVIVSALANLAHAVEYGKALAIFAQWGIQPRVYQVAFGAVLPVVSLLFASVLSNPAETEDAPNPELERAKADAAEARRAARESDAQRRIAEADRSRAEAERDASEQRFAAAGDLLARIMSPEKRQRILAVRETWPKLPPGAIAIIAETSPGYVSDVLKESEVIESVD